MCVCVCTQVLAFMRGRSIEISPAEGTDPSGLHIVCVINPLTRPAQRISQVCVCVCVSHATHQHKHILTHRIDRAESMPKHLPACLLDTPSGKGRLSLLLCAPRPSGHTLRDSSSQIRSGFEDQMAYGPVTYNATPHTLLRRAVYCT